MKREDRKDNLISEIRSRRKQRHFLCLLLTFVLFLSGCGSIILNGDLTFQANPPIQALDIPSDAWVGGNRTNSRALAAENVRFSYGDTEKYGIGGTRAFAILPGHVSPADVPSLNEAINDANDHLDEKNKLDLYRGDFRIINYDDATGRFIYSYYVPYVSTGEHVDDDYPEVSDTGLTVGRTGDARSYSSARPEKIADIKGMVFVLMSYAPTSGDYTVFFSKVFSMDQHKENDVRMLAGKVAGQPNYFAFADDYLYLYDRNGEKEYCSDYHTIVKSKMIYMIEEYFGIRHGFLDDIEYLRGLWHTGVCNLFWRSTVANVEMDENFMPYITLNIEVSTKNFSEADEKTESIIANDEDIEDSDDGAVDGSGSEKVGDVYYFHGTFACLRIDMDGSGMKFLSQISEESLNQLISDELTITVEEHDYEDERIEIEVEIEEDEDEDEDDGTAGTVPSEPRTEIRWETYDETLERLRDTCSAGHLPAGAEDHDLIAEYYEKENVMTYLNDFSIFDTAKQPGASGIYFALGGASSGREVNFYNAAGERRVVVCYGYKNYFPTYFARSNAGLFQRRLASDIAYDANSLNMYLPYLTPGAYGGRDWAYYDIGDRHERNGEYSLNGVDYLKGHAQPLVSPVVYKTMDLFFGNGAYKENFQVKVDPDNPTVLRRYDQNGNPFTGSVSTYSEQYYYNGVGNDYSIKYNSPFRSSYTDSEVDNLTRLSLYQPFVLAYHKTSYNDGTSEEEYATIQNDNGMVYILPTMTLENAQDITLRYQYCLVDGEKSEVYFEMSSTLTLPTEYRMCFPKGSYIQISGNVWIGNMVKAESEIGALTYYSTNGATLAFEQVWSHYMRRKYPIYDNASGLTLTSAGYNHGFLWWVNFYFLRDDAFYKFYRDNNKQVYSTIQVEKQGVDSVIYDRLVPGSAQDLGVWTIGGKTYVGYITDQVVRFYEKDGATYRAKAEISLDEIQVLSEGYFLRERSDGWVESYTNPGNANEQTATQLAEAAMNSDEGKISITSNNILPIGGLSRFLYFSESGNLYLMGLLNPAGGAEPWQKHARLMPLLDGTYYRVFTAGSAHKLVGFQTKNYSYTESDMCMARVYDINVSDLVQRRADESVNKYMESLRGLYLNETHTLMRTVTKVGEGQYQESYSIYPPDTSDTEYQRAERLFASSESVAFAEIDAICREYGVTRSAAMEDKIRELRNLLLTQRQALTEMYNFLGINFTGLPDKWQYIRYEGRMYNASYGSIIESIMVEIILSDEYLDPTVTPQLHGFDGLIGIHRYDPETDGTDVQFVDTRLTNGVQYVDEFAQYRAQYRLWLQSSQGHIGNEPISTEGDLTEQLISAYQNSADTQYITEITDMSFYKEVLNVLKEKYRATLL